MKAIQFLHHKVVRVSCFLLSTFLLTTNILGVNKSLRNDEILTEPDWLYKNDVTLTPPEFWEAIATIRNNDIVNVEKMAYSVSKRIAHVWDLHSDKSDIERYHMTLPIWKNWPLWFAAKVPFVNKWFIRFELNSVRDIIDRGVGTCSQAAIAFDGLAAEKGIPCQIVGLKGHVINEVVLADGRVCAVDPDMGLVFDKSVKTLGDHPDLIENAYQRKFAFELQNNYLKIDAEDLVCFYQSTENNRYYPGVAGYRKQLYFIEFVSGFIKWALPITGIFWSIPTWFIESQRVILISKAVAA